VLQVAPSTYYATKARQPSARELRDGVLRPVLRRLWEDNYRVYGAKKLWKAAVRAGWDVGRDQVARLMRAEGIRGARRTNRVRTTKADPAAARHPDLVERDFTATAPNQLWITDLTYVPTWTGVAYVCFITDVFSRTIVGWRVAPHMRTEMVLDAIEMARWSRGARFDGLRCHSDAGSQYVAIRYTQRLAEAGAVASVGSTGDSYDNALAEAFNSLFKAELVRNKGPWKSIDDLEIAVAEYIDWFNHRRLHGEIGLVPPAEHEDTYYRHNPAPTTVGASVPSLH
jgi:putative transposase